MKQKSVTKIVFFALVVGVAFIAGYLASVVRPKFLDQSLILAPLFTIFEPIMEAESRINLALDPVTIVKPRTSTEVSKPVSPEIYPKERIAGDYQWDDLGLQSQYSDALWNKITTSKLDGLSPRIPIVEKNTGECGKIGSDSYLRIEGGLCGVGYWLEYLSGERIDSKEELTLRFAPIENEAEAASFVAVIRSGIKINSGDVPEGHTLIIDDGFLVHLVDLNIYGCVVHEPTGIILRVTRNGEVTKVASEKQKPTTQLVPCVD